MAFKRRSKNQEKPKAAEEIVEVEVPVVEDVAHEEKPARKASPSSFELKEMQEEREARFRARQDDLSLTMKYAGAEKNKVVLNGVVGGVETRGGHTFLAIYDGPVTVLIPFHKAIAPETLREGIAGNPTRERQLLAKWLGSTVNFLIEKVYPAEDGTYLVSASRLEANAKIRARYFGENAANPVQVGQFVTGYFFSIGKDSGYLNVLGVDVNIHKKYISHRYIHDLQKYYNNGDAIKVQIIRIEDEDGNFDLVVSALPVELEEAQSKLGRVRVGTRCVAQLSAFSEAKTTPTDGFRESTAHLWLDSLGIPAYAKVLQRRGDDREPIYEGTKVVVSIDGVSGSGYVRVTILRLMN